MEHEFLFEMLQTASVSGQEAALEQKIYDYMKKNGADVICDEIANVTAIQNPDSKMKVLMTGHADEIGLMVTAIKENGMLRVTNIGGIYASCYPGHKVRVITEQGIVIGAVVITRKLSKKAEVAAKDITIDIGASSKEEAESKVALGDSVIFDTDCQLMLSDMICGRALDDRAGAYIVMQAFLRAREKGCRVGVYSAATVGEETTMNGAYFVSERVKPTIAIAVDVTYASDYPGADMEDGGDVKLGHGPVICNCPSVHRKINEMLRKTASKLNMRVQTEAESGRTGTDGDKIHQTGKGVPFALVSIPLRYMHSPSEMGNLKDMEDCIELLAQFLCDLTEDENFMLF